MNRISKEQRRQVIASLVEGNSIRATVRMTSVSRNTVTKLLTDMGVVCSVFQDRTLRDLACQHVQVDEVWAFVGAKEKNVKPERRNDGWGDIWTWVAIDADTKLVPTFRIGARDVEEATLLMRDLKKRLRHRVQLTTDGHRAYFRAVQDAFGDDVDYAMLIKLYGNTSDPSKPERRYSPGECVEAIPQRSPAIPIPIDSARPM